MQKLVGAIFLTILGFPTLSSAISEHASSVNPKASVLIAPNKSRTVVNLGDRYGVFCIINTTDIYINYQIKIGSNGAWKQQSMSPNYRNWYWHTYDSINENRSPYTWIRFDSALDSGEDFWTEYNITRYSSPNHDCDSGKKYEFRYQNGDRRYLELYSVN